MSGPSSTQTAPSAYNPSWQAGADSSYQNLLQGAQPWAQGLPGQVLPPAAGITGAIMNNPFADQMQGGANNVAQAGQNYTGVMDQLGGQSTWLNNYQLGTLGNLGLQASHNGTNAANLGWSAQQAGGSVRKAGDTGWQQTQAMIPSTTGGAQYANPALFGATNLANLTSNTALSAIPGLTGGMDAATQVLQNAFDPQGALYNRSYQQMMDQQNAINSQNGVAGGAYGAGLTGDASRNFNIDWQNNQLQRQISGLGAYGTEQSTVSNNLNNLLNGAASNYANLTNSGVNQYNSLTSTAANNLSNLVNTGMAAKDTGFKDYNAGVQTAMQGQMDQLAATNAQAAYANDQVANTTALDSNFANIAQQRQAMQLQSSMAPYEAFLANQQNAMGALSGLSALTGSALQPTAGLGQLLSNYMGLGQSATQINDNAVNINNQTAMANQGGIGSLLGSMFPGAMSSIGSSIMGGMGSLFGGGAAAGAGGGAMTGAADLLAFA